MQVKDIMTQDIEYVTNENTLQEAAEMMLRLDVGELPVVVGNEAVGIITDRDITVRGVAHGLDPKAATVVDAMTEGIISCQESDDIEQVARSMGSHKIRRMPVMDGSGQMNGMVSLADLSQKLDSAVMGDVLSQISR
jgi:CBS domain-containing protein